MKQVLPLVAVVAALGLGVGLAMQMQENSHLSDRLKVTEARLADAQENLQSLATEMAALRNAKAERAVAALEPESTEAVELIDVADGSGTLAGEEQPAEGEQKKGGGFGEAMAKMMKDPAMRKTMRAQQAFGMRMLYADLGKELGLGPQEIDHVMELLADRQMAMTEKGMGMMSGDTDPEKLQKLGQDVNATRQDYEAQIENVLGKDRYAKFQDFEKTIGDRALMQQYQQQFAARGTALQETQRQQLLDVMTEERLKAPASPFDPSNRDTAAQMAAVRTGEGLDEMMNQQKQINARVLDRSRSFLSPDQVNTLQQSQQQMMEMQEMGLKMSRQMFNREK